MPSHDKAHVLLVNDDSRSLFALQTILHDLDAEIDTAPSGSHALRRLLQRDFAVIVLDVQMPDMDGFETARLIRQRPRSRYTPIIFVTSHRATDLDRAIGYELGAIDYLFMPVEPEILKSKIQVFLDLEHKKPHPDGGLSEARMLRQEIEQLTRLNEALRAELAMFRQDDAAGPPLPERLIVQHAGDYVALLDLRARWIYVAPAYQAAFGGAIREGDSYLEIVCAEDRERVGAALAQLVEHGKTRLQYRVTAGERGERHLESEISLVRDADSMPAQMVMVSRDITERKEMEAYILHQSYHDALTGLPNRLLLEDRMRQATASLGRQQTPVGVLFIDLDRFKDVNDSLGHAAGDRLLQEVAKRLDHCVREGDTVARLSGDEFVVLLAGLHDTRDAALVAGKIVERISESCQIAGKELSISPSIGIAVFPDDGQNIDVLLRNADTAMYHAKQEGRGRFSFFAARMNDAANQRLAIGTALQRAILQGEFELYYQPKVQSDSGEIVGFEALIRWPQAGGQMLMPGQFISVAEDTGRIESIGRWALQEVARQVKSWLAGGLQHCAVAVNVSARQFANDSAARDIAAVLAQSGIPPDMLEAELTESVVMADPAEAIESLSRIRELGVAISIDDFGTGYSSLAYLKRFPIDKLKIDAAFVRDIAVDADDAAIVTAIITLAHSLGLTVIAEGVETDEQVRFLVSQHCDQMQGNYFSQPVPTEQAQALLRQRFFRLDALKGPLREQA